MAETHRNGQQERKTDTSGYWTVLVGVTSQVKRRGLPNQRCGGIIIARKGRIRVDRAIDAPVGNNPS